MKVYLINLDRSPERLARMTAILNGLDIVFERVAAVDGCKLSDAEMAALVSPRAGRASTVTRGEVGCLLSHHDCYARIAANDEAYSLILEDDVHLSARVSEIIGRSAWIPADADIVKIDMLGNDGVRVLLGKAVAQVSRIHAVHRLLSVHVGSAGYIVSRACAQRLLERTERYEEAIDRLLFDRSCGFSQGLTVYQVAPALCIQDADTGACTTPYLASLLTSERSAAPPPQVVRRRGLDKLWRELERPFERIRLCRQLRYLWTAAFTDTRWIRIRFVP